jgi:hypothetical protein
MNRAKVLMAAMLLACSAGVVNARDMFYILASRWCSTEWTGNKIKEFEITDRGLLFDGIPGESSVCTLRNATNRDEPFIEHIVTWRCDPTPSHEPGDRPTPRLKFYEMKERLVPFVIHDSNGGRRFFMIRDKLPIGRTSVGIYEQCRQ